jgi:phage-related protein
MLELAYTNIRGSVLKGHGPDTKPKLLRWVGGSRVAVRTFPEEVRRRIGFALWVAQAGSKASYVKPLKGFGGAGVLEILDDFGGDTYRTVYLVALSPTVYVLHAFQKKSKHGVSTPKSEIVLIKQRLRAAKDDHRQCQRIQRSK